MSIVKRKYFAMFMGAQKKWLNEMAKKGYRLIRVGKLEYEFEECKPGQYVYEIEYVGDKSFEQEEDYKAFLESLGYKAFYKNMNLDYSTGKVIWRPFAEKGGRISTSRSTYNRELLIIEKENDGKPFELHTTPADEITYLKRIRNPWLYLGAAFLAVGALLMSIKLLAVGILLSVPGVRAHVRIMRIRKEADGTDAGGPTGESTGFKIFLAVALIAVAGCFYLGANGVVKPPVSYSSGFYLGRHTNAFKGHFEMSITKGTGKMARAVSPKNDAEDLEMAFTTTSGEISVTVTTAEGTVLYESPMGSLNENVTIQAHGEKVIIYMEFDGYGGKMNIEYR